MGRALARRGQWLRRCISQRHPWPRAFGIFRCGAQINREMKFQVELVEKILRRCPFVRLAGKMDAHGAAWLNVTFKAPFYVASRNAQPSPMAHLAARGEQVFASARVV